MQPTRMVLQLVRFQHTQANVAAQTVRVGLLAKKGRMTRVFDRWGVIHPLTELKIDCCQVVQVKTEETNGYTALQVIRTNNDIILPHQHSIL
jgi:ribosomal protein L3